jgi:glycosyltransferase involved in cell wall biosynthesis
MTLQGKISIVIPCFNYGPLLLETLASIERVRIDTLAEVIIVNDGSTDPVTCDILERLETHKYIIIHEDNRGPAGARNAGIEIARGEFVLPLDSDDYIRLAYLQQGPDILVAQPQVGVIYGDLEFFGETTGRYRIPQRFEWSSIVKRNYIAVCALFRKSAWESVGGFDEEMRSGYEDWDFWMRVGLRGWKFLHLDEITFDYRIRTGSHNCDATRQHHQLAEYIFRKPEYEILRALRDQALQFEELSQTFESWDYRVGHVIVGPLRTIKRIPSGIRRRLRERSTARHTQS